MDGIHIDEQKAARMRNDLVVAYELAVQNTKELEGYCSTIGWALKRERAGVIISHLEKQKTQYAGLAKRILATIERLDHVLESIAAAQAASTTPNPAPQHASTQ